MACVPVLDLLLTIIELSFFPVADPEDDISSMPSPLRLKNRQKNDGLNVCWHPYLVSGEATDFMKLFSTDK